MSGSPVRGGACLLNLERVGLVGYGTASPCVGIRNDHALIGSRKLRNGLVVGGGQRQGTGNSIQARIPGKEPHGF